MFDQTVFSSRGIGVDVGVVPPTGQQAPIGVDLLPRLARVVGAVEPSGLPLRGDQGEYPIGVHRRDAHPDAPHHGPVLVLLGILEGRQSLHLLPGVTAVGRLVNAALGAPVDEGPGLALEAPHGGVELPRIPRVHREVDRSRAIGHEEDLLPGPSSVLRPVDASFLVAAEGVAQHRDVHQIGVPRVNPDASDQARLGETEVRPALAGVGRSVHAVAHRHVAPWAGRSGPDVHHVRVGLGDLDGADGPYPQILVRDVGPRFPGIGRLPDAPTRRSHVERERLGADAGDRGDPAATIGTDHAVLHRLVQIGIDGDVGVRRLFVGVAGESRAEGQQGQNDDGGQPGEAKMAHGGFLHGVVR